MATTRYEKTASAKCWPHRRRGTDGMGSDLASAARRRKGLRREGTAKGARGAAEIASSAQSRAASTAGNTADNTAEKAALWARLVGLEQAQGRFGQALYSERGELLERSSGRYALLKPGFWIWH